MPAAASKAKITSERFTEILKYEFKTNLAED